MFLRENPWAWAEENEYFCWFVSCFQFLYPSNKQVEKCGCCEAVFLISSENHKQFHHGVPVILRQILILLLLTPSYVAHLVEVERVDGAGPWDVDQSGDCRPQDAVVPQTGHPDRHQDQSCRETISTESNKGRLICSLQEGSNHSTSSWEMLIFPSVSPNSRLCERSFGPTDGEEKGGGQWKRAVCVNDVRCCFNYYWSWEPEWVGVLPT